LRGVFDLLEFISHVRILQRVGVLLKLDNQFIMSKNTIIAIIVLVVLVALVLLFGTNWGSSIVPNGEGEPNGQSAGPGGSDEPPVVEDGRVINLYFVSQELMEDGTVAPGNTVVAVERVIPEQDEEIAPEDEVKLLVEEVVGLLLAGPVGQETETLTTAIPAGTTLNEVIMREQTAFLDFSEEMANMSASSVSAMREQIYRTTTQFDEIVAVVEQIGGRPIEDYLP
jgi:hypothetical protein